MKHKVSELEGVLLDAAVAKAEGWTADPEDLTGWWSPDGKEACSITDEGIKKGYGFHPSHFWSQGGPIIEREHIGFDWTGSCWVAWYQGNAADNTESGPTALIAAMRAFVASKFGKEMELP